jgi:predicted ATP-binding protein involved in virulence
MRINSIKIENLFEIFNYDISFNNSENVLIITGPNGFGKTMILNVIFNLFNRSFRFFQALVFDKITLQLDDNISIVILKTNKKGESVVSFSFFKNNTILETFVYSNSEEPERTYSTTRYILKDGKLVKSISNSNDSINYDLFPNEKTIITSTKINEILGSIQVHLIQEQRLLKKAQNIKRDYREDREEQTIMIESIKTYAQELKTLISDFSQKSFIQTQDLDSSYPNRLRSETNILSKEEYERRYRILEIKQKKLTEFGLYESRQEFLTFSEEDAKALSVYLKDFELKLGVFDALLEKLELFTNILNERRFTFKSINISRDKGFFFKTIKNKELDLSQLSSGEQHEVVLLYELIFNVKPNVLVLIDEPEISLHITWQKEFLSDLLKIIKIQKIQVLIATHSPSIINDRWDLVYNLETKAS